MQVCQSLFVSVSVYMCRVSDLVSVVVFVPLCVCVSGWVDVSVCWLYSYLCPVSLYMCLCVWICVCVSGFVFVPLCMSVCQCV